MTHQDETKIWVKIKDGYNLPALSAIAVNLVELASDEKSSATDLAALIEKDPSLTVRIVKLANSAFFQTANPVATVRQAVVRLGFRQLRLMALTVSLRDTFPAGKVGSFNYKDFWRSSIYRAILARLFAGKLEGVDEDEAFSAGLTLEFGFLIFFDMLLKQTNEAWWADATSLEPLLDEETRRFGFNHRELGQMVLERWGFPETIVECQRFYGGEQSNPRASRLARVCRAASKLSALICRRAADFEDVYGYVASLLAMNAETIHEVVVETLGEVNEISGALNIDVAVEKDLLGLMEKANAALGRLSDDMVQPQEDCLPTLDTVRRLPDEKAIVSRTLLAVSHEIRNPLTVVGGFVRRLAKTLDPESEGRRYAELIMKETARLEAFLGELRPAV